jgi:hypothetical protein
VRRLSLPVDTGCGPDGYEDGEDSSWLNKWRVVVTAVRPGGNMCQIICAGTGIYLIVYYHDLLTTTGMPRTDSRRPDNYRAR